MKLELQDAKGSTGVFIEVPLEQIKEGIGLLSSSPETEAQLKESQGKVAEAEAQLKESQDKVGELETQLKENQDKAELAGSRTMDQYSPTEKANFVIAWAKELSPEKKARFAEVVGIPIAKATVAEVAEAEGNPKIIQGKTDKPGYIYYDYLNLSMRE